MTVQDLDLILDECLELIDSGATNLETCLARFPDQAAQLRPLLITAARLESVREIEPSVTFKARTRAQLIAHIRSHSHGQAVPRVPFKLAFALAALLLAFVTTGTAFAQAALPGEALYGWKLTSERVWRSLAADPIGVDIQLAERRAEEWFAVSNDPERNLRAQEQYHQALITLISEISPENEGRIYPAVQTQQQSVQDFGLPVVPIEELLPVNIDTGSPAPYPQATPTPAGMPTPGTGATVPPVIVPIPTELPTLIPSLKSPPGIPTVFSSGSSDPSNPAQNRPTLEIPALVP